MKLSKKKLQRSAAQTTQLIAEDMAILLETTNIVDMQSHPEFKEAQAIVAEYRHKSVKTVEIRFNTVLNLLRGKFYESIAQPTGQYLTGMVKGGHVTPEQIAVCLESICAGDSVNRG